MSNPTETPLGFERVLICGTGLIGTSIGLDLAHNNNVVEIGLYDPNEDHLNLAHDRLCRQAVDVGRIVLDKPGNTYDLAIVAAPPDQVIAVVARLIGEEKASLVTDLASVKMPIVQGAVAANINPNRFVPSHPMGGRETAGPAGAISGLFQGRKWPVTPLPETLSDSVAVIKRLAESCGATPLVMQPEQHDIAVAAMSHLVQLASTALCASVEGLPPELTQLAGGGWDSTTRLGSSPGDLWSTILTLNRGPVIAALAKYQATLDQLRVAIAEGDTDTIRGIYMKANDAKAKVTDAQQSTNPTVAS